MGSLSLRPQSPSHIGKAALPCRLITATDEQATTAQRHTDTSVSRFRYHSTHRLVAMVALPQSSFAAIEHMWACQKGSVTIMS
jgi:hypothetical protein